MMDLLELAERVIAEVVPSRELEIEIGVAVGLDLGDGVTLERSLRLSGMEAMVRLAESHQNVWRDCLPRYLTSRDAAMTLVPEGSRRVEFGSYGVDGGAWAYVHTPSDVIGESDGAHSEAAAICAAALRARASIPLDKE